MGVHYNGGRKPFHPISKNLPLATKCFKYKNGYFGEEGNNHRVRIIYSHNPIKEAIKLYKILSEGGQKYPIKGGDGEVARMDDGTFITFRKYTTSDNNPAIDININNSNDHKNLKRQKIHFEKR